jgi:hypothetical protein
MPSFRSSATAPSSWHELMRVNLDSVFYVGQAVARHMIGRKRGKIINIPVDARLHGGRIRHVEGRSLGRDALVPQLRHGAVVPSRPGTS